MWVANQPKLDTLMLNILNWSIYFYYIIKFIIGFLYLVLNFLFSLTLWDNSACLSIYHRSWLLLVHVRINFVIHKAHIISSR